MGLLVADGAGGNGGFDAAARGGLAVHVALAQLHGRGDIHGQAGWPRWADRQIGLEAGIHAAGNDGHGDRHLVRGLQQVALAGFGIVDDGDGGVELERPRAADRRQRKFRARAAIAVAPLPDGVLAHDATAIRQRGDCLADAERGIGRRR